MSQAPEKYKHPRWFRITGITYISLAILFFVVFLVAAIAKGDRPAQPGTPAYACIFWGGMLLLYFAIMGIPSLAFLSWGLSSRNKVLKYTLYTLAVGWPVLLIATAILN